MYLPHAQTAIYDSKVKLFLKRIAGNTHKNSQSASLGELRPILGIFDRTMFSYFSKYQCLPKTVKSFILHLHFFCQYYSVRFLFFLKKGAR
jgi:hypothetical protein